MNEVLRETGYTTQDIDHFVIHQANFRIIESIAKRLKVDVDKFPANMERYGNTSGASVPILLDELNRKGQLKRGEKMILSGLERPYLGSNSPGMVAKRQEWAAALAAEIGGVCPWTVGNGRKNV